LRISLCSPDQRSICRFTTGVVTSLRRSPSLSQRSTCTEPEPSKHQSELLSSSASSPFKPLYSLPFSFGLWAITAAKLAEQHAGHDHTSSHIHSHPQRPPNSKYSSASSLGAHDSSATSSSRQSTTSSASSYPASPSGEPTVARDITESVHEMANEADNFSDAGSEYSSDSNCSYDVAHPPSDLVTIAGAEPM
jgi:hypothetical protein